jgi:hypothetical protein
MKDNTVSLQEYLRQARNGISGLCQTNSTSRRQVFRMMFINFSTGNGQKKLPEPEIPDA